MHSAIRLVRQGRGYGISDVPVIDIAVFGGTVWHILDDSDNPLHVIHGDATTIERGVDAKIVSLRGKTICSRCRNALGTPPMPRMVKDGGGEEA